MSSPLLCCTYSTTKHLDDMHIQLTSKTPHLELGHFVWAMHKLMRLSPSCKKIVSPCLRRGIHQSQQHATSRIPTWGTPYAYLDKHPDEQAPPIPYTIGSQFTAIAYDPPTGFLEHHDWYWRADGQIRDDIENLPPLEACLRHPPAEGKLGSTSIHFRVLEHVRVGDQKNSQVLKVELTGSDVNVAADGSSQRPRGCAHHNSALTPTPQHFSLPGAQVAAKLYDPLYVDFAECEPDPFHNCDAAFYLETQAYRDYLRPLYGVCVPHFLGAYTIDVPVTSAEQATGSLRRTRPVRAILYEYIPGVPLSNGMFEGEWMSMYNQAQRKQIMRALVTAESKLRQLDVLVDQDFEPRNVIIKSVDEGRPADIRVIDFGAAQCGERRKTEAHKPTTEPEALSQIFERWRNRRDEFGYVDPANIRSPFADLADDWDWDMWLRSEYASQV